jgi:hypothetical protein
LTRPPRPPKQARVRRQTGGCVGGTAHSVDLRIQFLRDDSQPHPR